MDTSAYRPFLHELVRVSGDHIRPLFGRRDLEVELKDDESPVTRADRGAEEVLRALIRQRFPEHGIRGEEFPDENPGAEFVWVLDPIDGTKSFVTAVPLFVTLIALLHKGEPVLGCIHQPILNQLLIGDGHTTELNGQPVRVRPCARLEEATILTSDPVLPHVHQNGAAFDHLQRKARLARTWGDGYGYLLLASGWADLMCDPIMNPWDIMALVPIIRGAGGVITDWHGNDPVRGDSILAASPSLHATALEILRGG